MCQHIVQYFIKAITQCLQDGRFNLNMLGKNAYYSLVYRVDTPCIKDIDSYRFLSILAAKVQNNPDMTNLFSFCQRI